MKEALSGYDYIGVGRDDGKTQGEHSAIFYRTDKFDIIEKGDFGCRKLRMCRAKVGMRCCRVFAVGVTSNAKIPVLSSFSSIYTWTISVKKHVLKVRISYKKR